MPAIINITRRVKGSRVPISLIETSVNASVKGTPPETYRSISGHFSANLACSSRIYFIISIVAPPLAIGSSGIIILIFIPVTIPSVSTNKFLINGSSRATKRALFTISVVISPSSTRSLITTSSPSDLVH